jgi:4-hydroxy-2-oxoheptanedioate aldolase
MRSPDGKDPTPEEHEAAIQRVIEVGKKVGTPTGIHEMDAPGALKRAGQGMQFLAVGSDLRMMSVKSQELIAALRPAAGGKDVARY